MSGILEIRRGSTGISLTDGEFYLNKGINAVQIGSGSSILTLLPLNQTITGDIILNGSITANNLTGSAKLSASITSTENIGGIDTGTTFTTGTDFTALFSQLIASYQKPEIISPKLRFSSADLSVINLEVGATIQFNRIVVTSSIERPGTAYAQSISITASGATTTYSEFLGNTSTEGTVFNLGSIKSLTRSTPGSIVFTINGLSSTGVNLESQSIEYSFYFSNHLCASSTDVINNSTAQSVLNSFTVESVAIGSKNITFTTSNANNNSTHWTYIIYPASYGNLTSISQRSTDVFDAFTQLINNDSSNTIFTLSNENAISSNYYIYKSNASGAFASGVSLTIE